MNKNENYTHKNFYKNNDDFNEQISNLKKKFENTQKIKDFKNKMNRELLEILKKEKPNKYYR